MDVLNFMTQRSLALLKEKTWCSGNVEHAVVFDCAVDLYTGLEVY